MPPAGFQNLQVLVLESRRAKEMATLVSTYGGHPHSAPALREVPLDTNTGARAFVDALEQGEFDVVVFLTGVGLRALLEIVGALGGRERFVASLGRTRIVVRGPKPMAVLRELHLTPWVSAPEPNTWREVLEAVDTRGPSAVEGLRVAVQEYGRSPTALIDGLRERGARVSQVPIYSYALPDDLGPLETAVTEIIDGRIDVALFSTGTQVAHLFRVAALTGREDQLRRHLRRVVIASIGPTTSEELHEQGLDVDLEASHPKMGYLVKEAAERAAELVQIKRSRREPQD